MSVLQVGYHVAGLDTLANGIGQGTLQTVAGIELDAPLVGDEQDDQPVVFAFLAYAPCVEQFVAEVEAGGLAYAGHNGYDGLNARLLFQTVEHAVYTVRGGCNKDTLRVACVSELILDVYFGQVVGRVYFFLCLQTDRQIQEKKEKVNKKFRFHLSDRYFSANIDIKCGLQRMNG